MLAVQCSFCQHENVPGARFCAECGSPLHLRVCPNPACGKVSDVNARRCEHCGTDFPEIPLVEHGKTPDVPPPPDTPSPPKSISAWPLIVVALVAGGLPLLWINRAHLPKPKGWQAPPETPPLVAPPLATAPAPTVPAPSAPVAASAVPPPPVTPIPNPPVAVTPAANQTPAVPKPDPQKENKVKQKPKPTAKPSEPEPPCTEAIAAIGLCKPKSK